jgi:hypothetical protein
MELHAIGNGLGKTVFHLVGLDSSGRVVLRKRCSRTQLLAYTALGDAKNRGLLLECGLPLRKCRRARL